MKRYQGHIEQNKSNHHRQVVIGFAAGDVSESSRSTSGSSTQSSQPLQGDDDQQPEECEPLAVGGVELT